MHHTGCTHRGSVGVNPASSNLVKFGKKAGGGRKISREEMPADLGDFDPMAVPRLEFAVAAASGRSNDCDWGAIVGHSAGRLFSRRSICGLALAISSAPFPATASTEVFIFEEKTLGLELAQREGGRTWYGGRGQGRDAGSALLP